MIGLAVGVVVAVDEPDFRQTKDGLQFLLKRALRLKITKEDNRCWPMHAHRLNDEREISVYVATKKYAIGFQLLVLGKNTTDSPSSPDSH